ncbi:MAG TPA: AraC family transcriptional regulator [Acidimicrobiaceae bacterium]|nr:AraC family transcriptional regulator [Acidimicrobiaceae bacterium]|tara:strand:- start:204 stop:965 length:762 start_codon:yes stop_codon:yes gene_type:complete
MSLDRQSVGGPSAIVIGSFLLDRTAIETHHHDTHQLAWASRGVLTMGVDDRLWVLPRSRALWIPAGVPHDVRSTADTNMVSLYLDPESCPLSFEEPTVVDTSGLLGHLIDHLAGDVAPEPRRRAEAVVFDLISPLPAASLHVPLPVDERASRVAEALLADPSDPRTISEWGRHVGASGRTLARTFARDTGMTFMTWRTTARIAASLPLLGNGRSISVVAAEVGYSTPSAFVAAFRRVTGTTPGHYFQRSARSS